MTQVEAIYQGGVFKPTGDVPLAENQRVRLKIETIEFDEARGEIHDLMKLIEGIRAIQKRIVDRDGVLPNSTPEIAEDRNRDV